MDVKKEERKKCHGYHDKITHMDQPGKLTLTRSPTWIGHGSQTSYIHTPTLRQEGQQFAYALRVEKNSFCSGKFARLCMLLVLDPQREICLEKLPTWAGRQPPPLLGLLVCGLLGLHHLLLKLPTVLIWTGHASVHKRELHLASVRGVRLHAQVAVKVEPHARHLINGHELPRHGVVLVEVLAHAEEAACKVGPHVLRGSVQKEVPGQLEVV